MPELPEVETTRRGIEPHLLERKVVDLVVRQAKLRWPIPAGLGADLLGCRIEAVGRRAKYILIDCGRGHLIVHLGMTGSLRIVGSGQPALPHDHFDLVLSDSRILRLRDPRRFGAVLWTSNPPADHPLLRHLGPEPMQAGFNADYLYHRARNRKTVVKSFIMDGRTVVGVGNIYANEALYLAGIHPGRAAGRISLRRYGVLVEVINTVLARAIALGGTTLRDFVGGDGRPGYFGQELQVYGRRGEPCLGCGTVLREIGIGQRTTVFCPVCQR